MELNFHTNGSRLRESMNERRWRLDEPVEEWDENGWKIDHDLLQSFDVQQSMSMRGRFEHQYVHEWWWFPNWFLFKTTSMLHLLIRHDLPMIIKSMRIDTTKIHLFVEWTHNTNPRCRRIRLGVSHSISRISFPRFVTAKIWTMIISNKVKQLVNRAIQAMRKKTRSRRSVERIRIHGMRRKRTASVMEKRSIAEIAPANKLREKSQCRIWSRTFIEQLMNNLRALSFWK